MDGDAPGRAGPAIADAFPLTEQQIATFKEEGLLVVEGVFSGAEVAAAREGFHRMLRQHGIDHDNLDADLIKRLGRFGDHAQYFYPSWKLALHEHPAVFAIVSQLWAATFATGDPLWAHPYGPFDPTRGYLYIDRENYRVPDFVVQQGGLGPHLDCSSEDMYHLADGVPVTKWRPIQAWVGLTDHWGSRSGGLTAARGFHKEFDRHFREVARGKVVGRDFTLIEKAVDPELWRRSMQPVEAPAGSVVLWDNRLPHATAKHHDGPDTREVAFTGFLPDVPVNRAYAAEQLQRYLVGARPPDFGPDHKGRRETLDHEFSPLGRCLMAMDPWETYHPGAPAAAAPAAVGGGAPDAAPKEPKQRRGRLQ